MCLDYLHIKVVTQDLRDIRENLETDIHPHRHVWGEDCRYILRQFRCQGTFFRGEAGGADYYCLAVESAYLKVLEGYLWCGEVYKHIAPPDRLIQVVGYSNIELPATGDYAGILAYHGMARPLNCSRDLDSFRLVDCDYNPPPRSARRLRIPLF